MTCVLKEFRSKVPFVPCRDVPSMLDFKLEIGAKDWMKYRVD